MLMHVHIIPVLQDNYAYIIQSGAAVAVIDPGEAAPVLTWLNHHALVPEWIINTHKHGDHTAGNAALLGAFPDARLAAPAECGAADITLQDGVDFPFGDTILRIIETKGHTAGHVVLFDSASRILFSGDTLFALGCGRVLEGTMEDMFLSLQTIKALPQDTLIYCGHEYTAANAAFACHILPDHPAIAARLQEIKGENCTMPTTLAQEMATNPFLMAKAVEEFSTYRRLKDQW